MAFFSKVGGILKQAVGKQIDLRSSPANPSIFHALRWMSSSKVFIGGLSYSTDDTGLRDAFSQYGNVVDARVIVDRESGRSRGFGFVSYTSSEEANSAIQALDGQDLHGRRVRVAYATDRARPYGGGGGGSYGGGGGYGGGSYDGAGGNQGGNYGGYSASGSGGFGGSGYGNQGGVDGYGSGGANYGGGYAGGSFSPGGYNAGGSDASTYDGAANFVPSGGAGGNVTAETSFATGVLEQGSGFEYKGGSDQFGVSTTSGLEGKAGEFEPNEQLDRDEDENESDDFAKRA